MATCLACNEELVARNGKYCNNTCQKDKEHRTYIEQWKCGLKTGTRGISTGNFSGHIVRYMFDKYSSRCSLCGWNRVNRTTGKIPLEIDHIDGNSDNNTEDNLVLLCPNCHSLTNTYKNLNNGHGRRWRNQKYMLQ